jgi:hypothetical protein
VRKRGRIHLRRCGEKGMVDVFNFFLALAIPRRIPSSKK